MKIEKLEKGMRVKNYKHMCELLGEKVVTSNSKKSQIKKWKQYFSFHREGHAFIIGEVYDSPLPPLPSQPKSLRSDNVYTGLIEAAIMNSLAKNKTLEISKSKLYELLGLCSKTYADTTLCLSKIENLKDSGFGSFKLTAEEVEDYFDRFNRYAHNKLNKITVKSLESMKRRRLIDYRYTYNIVEEFNGQETIREASDREIIRIREIIGDFLKENPKFRYLSVYLVGSYRIMLNAVFMEKEGWVTAYPVIKITAGEAEHHGEYSDENRTKLNRIVADRLAEHFAREFEKAESEGLVESDNDEWGESNKMCKSKKYTADFVRIQRKLIDTFIRIDEG